MAEIDQGTQLTWASERHLRVCFGNADTRAGQSQVLTAATAIEQARLPELVAITPAYSTILLEFAPHRLDERRTIEVVRQALKGARDVQSQQHKPVVEIPVCYEAPCALDAADVARFHGIDAATLIHLHTQPLYTVQFIGFAPGFGYLSGLPSELATPRLDAPRVRVPAGSVGIAGDQTGIYPTATAGGWRLIGRTPLVMFDACRENPSLLHAGDRVRFIPIGITEFEERLRGLPDHE